MKKQQVLDALKCSDDRYKKLCETLEIQVSDDFPAAKFADCCEINGWFEENKSLSVKSAIARYKEFMADEVSPIIEEIAPLIDEGAHRIMDTLVNVAQEEESSLAEQLRSALRARIYQLSQTSEYKEKFAAFAEGRMTVEEVGKPFPVLNQVNSEALPPGLD